MSNLVRRIQRQRASLGERLGVNNPKDKPRVNAAKGRAPRVIPDSPFDGMVQS